MTEESLGIKTRANAQIKGLLILIQQKKTELEKNIMV